MNIYDLYTLNSLKGYENIHTEGFSKFHSNIYSILFVYIISGAVSGAVPVRLITSETTYRIHIFPNWFSFLKNHRKKLRKFRENIFEFSKFCLFWEIFVKILQFYFKFRLFSRNIRVILCAFFRETDWHPYPKFTNTTTYCKLRS